jgi:hypothetical protein
MRRLLALALLCLSIPLGAADHEDLDSLELRWRELTEAVRDVSYAERLERTTAFLQAIPWDQIAHYCGDYSDEFGPDRQQFLAGLVDGMLRRTEPPVANLAAMIADPEMNTACQGAVAKFISARRDSFAARPDGALLGQAFFALAESGTRAPQMTRDCYAAAASLWAGEPLMQRMMADARHLDESTAMRGIDMLVSSCDPTATDSLQAVLAEYRRAGRLGKPLRKGITMLAVRGGPERFGFLLEAYRECPPTADAELRNGLLLALARTQHAGAYAVILDAYGDSASGVADSTWALKDVDMERYRAYYWLWHCTREAEPGIIAVLTRDDPLALAAVELLDRASRFGLPASREGLLRPLATWAERHGAPWRERIALIINRFNAYPDPRQG